MGNFKSRLKHSTYENTEEFTLNGLTKKCKILKVYDGDTLWLSTKLFDKLYKFKIRMMGYDSPEMKPRLNNPNRELEIEAAIRAKNRLEELILNKIVNVKFHKDDKYGRPLCTIYTYKTNGYICKSKTIININSIMIEEGFGYSYDGGKKTHFKNLRVEV